MDLEEYGAVIRLGGVMCVGLRRAYEDTESKIKIAVSCEDHAGADG